MPIYGFECTTCGHSFDKLQKLSDADPETCPSCGAATVKRQITAPSFRLAGGGWYETDFKKGSDKKRNLAEGGSSPGGAESKPAASDSKPATPSSTPSSSGGSSSSSSGSSGSASD